MCSKIDPKPLHPLPDKTCRGISSISQTTQSPILKGFDLPSLLVIKTFPFRQVEGRVNQSTMIDPP